MENEPATKITVRRLAEEIGAELVGDGSGQISDVSTVEAAGHSDVTFISKEKYFKKLKDLKAGAVIIMKKVDGVSTPQLVVENVDAALIKTLGVFAPKLTPPKPGIDPGAVIAETAKISKSASIGPDVHIGKGAEVGANSVITAGCKIGEKTKIGDNCRLDNNVVIHHNCIIGNNVIIQANSTIGSTGFGYSY